MKVLASRWVVALVVGAALAPWSGAFAQQADQPDPTPEAIAGFIQDAVAELSVPGAAAAVIDDGRITLAKGFGRRGASGARVTANTPFQIASVSKSFTSLVILQLAAEGRFSIDDPVIEHMPYFGMADPEHARAVTIRQLMDHTSGFSTLDGNRFTRPDDTGPDAMERAVRALRDAQPHAAPGVQFQYSNANYRVLGNLIEMVEEAPYEAVLEARIFSRIGMTDTFAGHPKKQTAPVAKGHSQWFGTPRERHLAGGRMMVAAGGLTSSAEDLAKYLLALMQSDARIVPPALTRSWERDSFTGYEYGWHHAVVDGRRAIFHDGLNPGFRSLAVVLPDEGKAAVFMMNMSGVLDGSLPVGATHFALELPPVAVQPSKAVKISLWGSLAGVVCFALGCFAALRKVYKLKDTPWPLPKPGRWAILALPPVGLVGLAFAMLFIVPASLGVTFPGARVFYPDLGLLLLTVAVVALIWAIVMPALLRQRPKPETG